MSNNKINANTFDVQRVLTDENNLEKEAGAVRMELQGKFIKNKRTKEKFCKNV